MKAERPGGTCLGGLLSSHCGRAALLELRGLNADERLCCTTGSFSFDQFVMCHPW